MKFSMTRDTKRNNIKSMFKSVTGMMVLFCLFATIALESIGTRQFAGGDGIVYSSFSFFFLWMYKVIFFRGGALSSFPFFCSLVALAATTMTFSAFFCLLVFSIVFIGAYSTPILKSVFVRMIFIELRNRPNLLALATAFCYDCFKHGFLLTRKSCSESIAAHTVVGSFYFTANQRVVK